MPSSGTPAGGQRRRQVERRLAAERDHRGQRVRRRPGRLGVDDLQHALRVERLEVQPGGRVEVGRDGLRVRVDHHRRPAGPAKRVGGLDRAVVELDALPDPDRAAADDEGGRPRARAAPRAASRPTHRSSRSRASRRRTPRRTCRPSRSPAEPDGQCARRARARSPRRPARRCRGRRTPARLAVARSWPSPERPPDRSRPRADSARAPPPGRRCGPSPRGTRARSRSPRRPRPPARPPQQPEHPPQPRIGRLEEAPQDDRRGRSLGVAGRLAGLARSSTQRIGSSASGSPRVDGRRGSRTSASRSGPRRAARRPPARGRGAPC